MTYLFCASFVWLIILRRVRVAARCVQGYDSTALHVDQSLLGPGEEHFFHDLQVCMSCNQLLYVQSVLDASAALVKGYLLLQSFCRVEAFEAREVVADERREAIHFIFGPFGDHLGQRH